MELTTLVNVKSWLKISNAANDVVLTRVIEAAESRIRGLCESRTSFLTGTYVERFDGNSCQLFRLKHSPITSITSVVCDGVTIASTLYTFAADRNAIGFINPGQSTFFSTAMSSGRSVTGQSFNTPSFGSGFNTVAITYVGGYANTAAIPDDLEQAVIELASIYYQSRGRDPGLISETLGSYSWTRAENEQSIEAVVAKLAKYGADSPI